MLDRARLALAQQLDGHDPAQQRRQGPAAGELAELGGGASGQVPGQRRVGQHRLRPPDGALGRGGAAARQQEQDAELDQHVDVRRDGGGRDAGRGPEPGLVELAGRRVGQRPEDRAEPLGVHPAPGPGAALDRGHLVVEAGALRRRDVRRHVPRAAHLPGHRAARAQPGDEVGDHGGDPRRPAPRNSSICLASRRECLGARCRMARWASPEFE
ncbi:hypothetical protein M0M43_00525 [Pimelobacter simplex]|nr:hypothetical protein [Pimelobacter simplex]UUW90001.1 hypothetical protein M0M43_00525 [Pimelobacter simplex]